MKELGRDDGATRAAGVRAFLIADLRGYTSYTEDRGDEAAAALTVRFAEIARIRIEAAGGTVVELRGDEVLAEFQSPRDSLRAAIGLHSDIADAEGFPLEAGAGLDVGEAAPVGEGYRGRAINMAARLCARAQPGETLVTPEFAHLAGAMEGVSFEDGGPVRLKGVSRPVHLLAAVPTGERAVRTTSGALSCAVLGPLGVTVAGNPVGIGGPKQRLVLAHLLLAANRVVSMDELIDAVWDEEPPKAARNTIQSYVSHLRGALGPERIESRSPGYVFHAEPEELDLLRFERALQRARRWIEVDPERAVTAFDDALTLWRGTPLADLAEASSLAGEIARLDELRLAAIEDRLQARLALGERDLVGELQPLVDRYPLRERLWAQLMVALYRTGRQAEALAAYDRARSILSDELGVDPSPDLRDLHAKILQQDPSLDAAGRPLRSYRLLEEIGSGADGVVWRAIDPAVGREVAVKQIAPEIARDPAFVRRFQQEAQLVARLEHPHIVPLYDVWRDGNGAFLVMRLLRGGSLADALTRGPMPLDQVIAIVDQIASALAAVHRHRLVHRDVRPENVLLDEEGNAYLSDLGIATEEGTATSGDDIAAFGHMVAAMVGPAAPSAVGDVITTATAVDPNERYPDAEELARALGAAITVETVPVVEAPEGPVRNPYKGLRPFSEADANDFFGRDALIERLVRRMSDDATHDRFLALVGPSGSGKSSVVRAGLLPALRGGAVPGSDQWFFAEMLPGARPMDELETSLLRAGVDPALPLIDGLERDPHGLSAAIERILPPDGSELLLLVDQFEEVFTLVSDENTRARFLETLVAAVTDPTSRLRLVVTLRADFFDRPLAYPGLAELMRARSETTVPLTAEELEQAISGPAHRVGCVPELALVAEAVGDVTDQPGALPLLQYALTETFEARARGVLTLESYRAIGGVTGALAKRAEQLYGAMNDDGHDAARQLFLRLVSVDEGSEDTRRLVSRAELASLEIDQRSLDAVIDAFGKHRLLSFDRDPETRGPTVEVAHEALLRAWMRLRGWIDTAREDVITHRRLAAEADEWERSSRDPSFLLRGSRLAQLDAWATATTLALSGDERRFLADSVGARASEEAEEREREERERALERRSVVRLRGLVAVLTAAALIASTLVVLAVGQRGNARQQAAIARGRELAAAADANLSVDPERSVLLALQAVETRQPDGAPLPEAMQSLQNAVAANRQLMRLSDPSTGNVAYSPDGRLIATGGSVGGSAQTDVLLWDAGTGELVHRLSGHGADIWSVAFDPTGDLLVSTSDDRDAIVWDTATGEQVRRFPEIGVSASFSPSGAKVIAADHDAIHLADIATGAVIDVVSEPGVELCSPTFSPDGRRIAAGRCEDKGIEIWDAISGRPERVLGRNAGVGFLGGIFSPDGSRIAGNSDDTTYIWLASSGEPLVTINGYRGQAYGLAFGPDGTTLATSGEDGTARVWDAKNGKQLVTLAGHQGLVGMVSFSPDGSRIVTGGADGAARVWDVTPTGPGLAMGARANSGYVSSVAFTPDGRGLVTAGWEGGWLWDLASGDRIRNLPEAWGAGTVSQDGSLVVAESTRDRWGAGVWQVDTGRQVRFLPTPNGVSSTSMSTSGTMAIGLACWSPHCDSAGALLWDPASPKGPPAHFGRTTNENYGTQGVALSKDGSTLATIDGRGVLRIFDVLSGRTMFVTRAQSGQATAVAFAPNGSTIATTGGEGVTLWNAQDGRRLATLGGVGALHSVTFSDDGKLVAAGGVGDRTTIWDLESGRRVVSTGGLDDATVNGVALNGDGSILATADSRGVVKVYALTLDELERIARSQLTRGFTDAECSQYLHVSPCPNDLTAPAGSGPPPPQPSEAVQGSFRTDISTAALASRGYRSDVARDSAGGWTLMLVDGRYIWHQTLLNGWVWQTTGMYTVQDDMITLVDGSEPDCIGSSWTARWRLTGPDLTLSDGSWDPTPSCVGSEYDWVISDIMQLHPWHALAHHSSVG